MEFVHIFYTEFGGDGFSRIGVKDFKWRVLHSYLFYLYLIIKKNIIGSKSNPFKQLQRLFWPVGGSLLDALCGSIALIWIGDTHNGALYHSAWNLLDCSQC